MFATGVSQLCFLGVSKTLALVLEPDMETRTLRLPGVVAVSWPFLLLPCSLFLLSLFPTEFSFSSLPSACTAAYVHSSIIPTFHGGYYTAPSGRWLGLDSSSRLWCWEGSAEELESGAGLLRAGGLQAQAPRSAFLRDVDMLALRPAVQLAHCSVRYQERRNWRGESLPAS